MIARPDIIYPWRTKFLKRLITGDGMRKSRFHNYNGQFLDAAGFAYLPQSVLTTLCFKLANHRPKIPWLGFRAISYLDALINKDWRILEFGSGMSTLWLARRCKLLVSIETNEPWYQAVRDLLNTNTASNVDYILCRGSEEESVRDYPASTFDFVLVDGFRRDSVMTLAISKVKTGGYIFLDNSDVPYDEHRIAKSRLLQAAGDSGEIRHFNDLYPTQVCVNESILARVVHKDISS